MMTVNDDGSGEVEVEVVEVVEALFELIEWNVNRVEAEHCQLALVMAAGLSVTFVGYRLVLRRSQPVLAEVFQVPDARQVDAPLALGAILFGLGWGLVGLCPGPAIAAAALGGLPILIFLAAMFGGMAAYQVFARLALSRQVA